MRGSFRRAAAIATSCFLVGVLLLAHPLAWRAAPDSLEVEQAASYYQLWWTSHVALKAVLHGVIGCLLIALAAKLAVWTEEALYFDGASMLMALVGFAVYGIRIVPGIHHLVPESPEPAYFALSKGLKSSEKIFFPAHELSDQGRIQTINLISFSCFLIVLAVTSIIVLQLLEYFKEKQYQERVPWVMIDKPKE